MQCDNPVLGAPLAFALEAATSQFSLYKKTNLLVFSKINFLSLTCYKMSHIKKLYMCEVYSTSMKTLQTKQFFLSLFKMLLLQAELKRETSYV